MSTEILKKCLQQDVQVVHLKINENLVQRNNLISKPSKSLGNLEYSISNIIKAGYATITATAVMWNWFKFMVGWLYKLQPSWPGGPPRRVTPCTPSSPSWAQTRGQDLPVLGLTDLFQCLWPASQRAFLTV